jgi:hypothetical protein
MMLVLMSFMNQSFLNTEEEKKKLIQRRKERTNEKMSII